MKIFCWQMDENCGNKCNVMIWSVPSNVTRCAKYWIEYLTKKKLCNGCQGIQKLRNECCCCGSAQLTCYIGAYRIIKITENSMNNKNMNKKIVNIQMYLGEEKNIHTNNSFVIKMDTTWSGATKKWCRSWSIHSCPAHTTHANAA